MARGETYVTDVIARHLLAQVLAPHEELSTRESRSSPCSPVAGCPPISPIWRSGPTTVSTYVARIRQKLGVRSISEIISHAYRRKLAE